MTSHDIAYTVARKGASLTFRCHMRDSASQQSASTATTDGCWQGTTLSPTVTPLARVRAHRGDLSRQTSGVAPEGERARAGPGPEPGPGPCVNARVHERVYAHTEIWMRRSWRNSVVSSCLSIFTND